MVYLKGDKETIESIAYMEEVEKVYPNRKVDLIKPEKSAPLRTLENTDGVEWNIKRVGADQAWELGYDGTGIVVGMIDSGIDWTRPALKDKWRGYNPADPNNPNPDGNWFDAVNGEEMPYDILAVPHGTHVMGTILGQDPEGNNKIGVAPDVINNSWSGGSGRDDWYMDMVSAWRAAEIVPVFAAGNFDGIADPGSIANPANYPQSFAVGATDRNDIIAPFSGRGPGPYNDDIKPEIVAPGVGVRSAVPGGYEGGWNGTSMATPHVAGAVALLRSVNSSLTASDIEDILIGTAKPLTDNDYPESPNYGYGHGLLDVFEAVSEVSTGTGVVTGEVSLNGEDLVEAVVTVLETGRSAKVDPTTGTYRLIHAANKPGEKWTLRATAYGYKPEEVEITLEEGAEVEQNFKLDSLPKGNIVGKVIDRDTGDVIPDTHIRVIEDTKVDPVYSDNDGNFKIEDVLEGEYTLRVIANDYQIGEAKVKVAGNKDTEVEIGLDRFVGYEEEIVYDDGTADNALVLNTANSGLAIRVTLERYGRVKGANIYFWGDDWPTPGGNEIGIAIFDTDEDGNPAEMIGRPKIVTVNRGEWNYIDLSDFGFFTDKDFFITTVQTEIGDYSPGVGLDEDTPHIDRSYLYVGGEEFIPLYAAGIEGGVMIRGIMEYGLGVPTITNLDKVKYTKEDSITIEGEVTADSVVNVYLNDEKVAELETEGRKFAKEIELPAEENNITVSATADGKETTKSEPVLVIKDKEAPELTITSPEDGAKINRREVTVKGNVKDANLDKVLVKDEAVEVDENGDFSKDLVLEE